MDALQALKTIKADKESRHVVPTHAGLAEIKNLCGYDPLDELRELWQAKKIKSIRTLNSLAFDIYVQENT